MRKSEYGLMRRRLSSLLLAVTFFLVPFGTQCADLPKEPVNPKSYKQCTALNDAYKKAIGKTRRGFLDCFDGAPEDSEWGGVKGEKGCPHWGPKACYHFIEECDSLVAAQQSAVPRCKAAVKARKKQRTKS